MTTHISDSIVVHNIKEYDYFVEDNNLIIRRKIATIDEATLFQKNLKGGKLQECYINNTKITGVKNFFQLIRYIYGIISNSETILHHTILNIIKGEKNDKGFNYDKNLGLSIQGVDTRRALKEIINITNIKKCKLELNIKLETGEIIRFIK